MNRQGLRKPRPRILPRNVYRRGASVSTRQPGTRLPGRQLPFCHIKALCGACKYVNLDYKEGLDEKFKAGLATLERAGVLEVAKILPPMPSPREFEYRSLFKLAVRPTPQGTAATERFAIGLFEAGSHQVVDMDTCPLHTMPLKRLLTDLRTELNASALVPYDEKTHTGQLRYLAARAAHLTGELMLTFVVTEALKPELRRIVQNLLRHGHKINSAHMNLHPDKNNAIFGAETIHLAGSARLRERLCDLDFEIGPTSFFQVNPWQAINLYRRVEQIAGLAPVGSSMRAVAWDLYCGTGQISLVLARQGYRVLGVEENEKAVDDARANARKNHLEKNAEFISARVEHMAPVTPDWAAAPSLIVVNPSRRGLAQSTREHLTALLAAHPRARFLYVSCEVETLARDLKELAASGFKIRQVEPFDMFPQTDNMEWLAVLSAQ